MMKDSWDDRPLEYCRGGCGKLARRCCDSVLGEPHQSVCRATGPFRVAPRRPRRLAAIRALILGGVLLIVTACQPGDTIQVGDTLCTVQFNGSLACEPLHGEWEVR